MSNPPRRSRPKKPERTIDLKAETASRVGYAGPASTAKPKDDSLVSPSQPVAAPTEPVRDPETEIAASASPAPDTVPEPAGGASARTPMPVPATAESEAAALGVQGPKIKRGDDEAQADGGARTTRAFAEDESLQNTAARTEDYDEDTILAAAVPDLVARESDPDRPSGPPAPSFDYSRTSSHQEVRGGGPGAAIGAGLLGAILALAGAGALQYAGLIPAVQAPGQQQPTQQFAAPGDVQQVANDLATLRGSVEQLQSAQAAGGAGAGASVAELTAVADRVTAIEQRAGQDNPQQGDGVSSTEIDEIRKVADTARQTSETARQTSDAARQSADTARQSADTARQSSDAARQAADAASQAVAQIRDTAGGAQAAAQQATQTAQAAQQAAATSQQTAAGAQQDAATAQSTASAAAQAVDGFKPRIDAVEKSNKQAAIALSAAGLKAAIDRGQPFMSELEAYATSSGGGDAVTTLRSYAARGVPSSDALQAQWPDVSAAVSAALTPADPNADVKTQIFSGLKSLVNVRPAGPVPESAPGPQAALSRLDGAVDGGDFAGFLSEWDKLPDAAKEASRDFQDRVKARIETDRVVDDALAQAVRASGTAG